MSNSHLTLALPRRFMTEVLDSVETLEGVAESHGVQTLVDLVYFQDAILNEGFINDEGHSSIREILKSLPSADLWMTYVRCDTARTEQRVPARPFVLQTGLTTVNEETMADEAQEHLDALEALYDTHYDESAKRWTWDDTHPTDHCAFVELTEVIRSSRKPPLDSALLSSFRDPDWRMPFI